MSGSAATAGPPPGAAPPQGAAPAAAPLSASLPDAVRVGLVRLAAFAGLGLFAAAHWVTLVTSPPVGRTVLVVLVSTGTAGLMLLAGARAPRRLAVPLALAIGVAGLLLALVAMGLPLRLLAPGNWDELFDGLDRGLAGVQTAEWPYNGSESWVRLTTLLGAPLGLGLAALLAFTPSGRAAPVLSVAGLGVLLLVYGSAVTEHDPGEPLLRGLALLVLVAAWLWLPRLGSREALAGGALVLALGALSMPVAAALDADRPWWNYGAWTFLENDAVITFDWNHRYGPLDWPREGTTLLNVRSRKPHYWKAETLDTFNGVRWVRGPYSSASSRLQGVPDPTSRDGHWDYFEWNPRWDENLRFTVRSLSTDLLVAAGTPYLVEGAGLVSTASDGTTRIADRRLDEGDSYTVRAYVPNPTPTQMRGAPDGLSNGLAQYTSITAPHGQTTEDIFVQLWGNENFGDPDAAGEVLANSSYSEMYAITRRVTAGAPTMYDAVDRIERYLNRNFSYSEKPRGARYPLNAFMFRDKFGYCQQFSGAMALMLRMVGIPARVAAGFAPGSFNRDSGEYRVRDLDAHSWVEVYFNGIGWVTFDPTPAAAPADSQAADRSPTSASGGVINGGRAGLAAPDPKAGAGGVAGEESGGGLSAWLLVPLLVLAGVGLLGWRATRRARRLSPAELADAQLAELRRALAWLDWDVPAQTTLARLEGRLGRAAGPAAARYAAALRANRYDPSAPAGPGLRERRALRRDLTARTGLRGRIVGLIAIPPGGPRPV